MKHDIRMIAADLDGTLLGADRKISAYNLEMIRQAQQRGIIFAACTGRYPENAAQMMLDAGIICPVVSTNGAVAELSPYGERIREVFMDAKATKSVFEQLEALGAGYYMFGKETVDSRRDLPRHISEADPEHLLKLKQRVCYQYGLDACRAALERPVYKFFVYFDKGSSTARDINTALSGIPGIGVTQSGSSNLEIMSSAADKGIGLQVLCQALGIKAEQTMALGDQLNDLPMIRYAGLGIAMGNAPETVRQAADAVTQRNTDDGVGKAIQRFVLSDYPLIDS